MLSPAAAAQEAPAFLTDRGGLFPSRTSDSSISTSTYTLADNLKTKRRQFSAAIHIRRTQVLLRVVQQYRYSTTIYYNSP